MPSPFPGMDPYLEDSTVWPGQHHRLITAATQLLQKPLNARGYFADIGERIWLVDPRRHIYPDVAVLPSIRPPRKSDDSPVAVVDEPVRVRRNLVEVTEPFVVIYDSETRCPITGIEFISPTKKSTTDGRILYRRKQREMRRARVNRVEFDFIRRGRQLVDVPDAVVRELSRHDYLVNLVRHPAIDYEVYPIRLRDHLPRIRIPLKSGDEDAVLDLQMAFDRAYDEGPYAIRIDYRSACEPSLADDDAAWTDELLRLKGLR